MPSASMILPTSFCFCAAEKTISSVRYPGSICIPAQQSAFCKMALHNTAFTLVGMQQQLEQISP